MLYSVCHTWHITLITEVAHIHVHRRTGFISLRIVNQQRLELIWKTDDAICSIIQ